MPISSEGSVEESCKQDFKIQAPDTAADAAQLANREVQDREPVGFGEKAMDGSLCDEGSDKVGCKQDLETQVPQTTKRAFRLGNGDVRDRERRNLGATVLEGAVYSESSVGPEQMKVVSDQALGCASGALQIGCSGEQYEEICFPHGVRAAYCRWSAPLLGGFASLPSCSSSSSSSSSSSCSSSSSSC